MPLLFSLLLLLAKALLPWPSHSMPLRLSIPFLLPIPTPQMKDFHPETSHPAPVFLLTLLVKVPPPKPRYPILTPLAEEYHPKTSCPVLIFLPGWPPPADFHPNPSFPIPGFLLLSAPLINHLSQMESSPSRRALQTPSPTHPH